jgi:hypothetical protein
MTVGQIDPASYKSAYDTAHPQEKLDEKNFPIVNNNANYNNNSDNNLNISKWRILGKYLIDHVQDKNGQFVINKMKQWEDMYKKSRVLAGGLSHDPNNPTARTMDKNSFDLNNNQLSKQDLTIIKDAALFITDIEDNSQYVSLRDKIIPVIAKKWDDCYKIIGTGTYDRTANDKTITNTIQDDIAEIQRKYDDVQSALTIATDDYSRTGGSNDFVRFFDIRDSKNRIIISAVEDCAKVALDFMTLSNSVEMLGRSVLHNFFTANKLYETIAYYNANPDKTLMDDNIIGNARENAYNTGATNTIGPLADERSANNMNDKAIGLNPMIKNAKQKFNNVDLPKE